MTFVFSRLGSFPWARRSGPVPTRRTRTRLLGRAVAGAAVLAMVAGTAACSDKSTSGAGGPTILRVSGAPTGPIVRNFNPFQVTAPVYLLGGESLINEPLFIPNTLKVDDYTPWLAKSWQFSPDGKQLTLNLQTGVKWTDGQAFTSDDVAFTFDMIVKNPALNLNGLLLTEAHADGPDKVVLTFPAPAATQLPFVGMTYIVPKHIWETAPDPNTFTFENPIGTGPFMLDSWSPQGYLLKKNPNYWQPGKPKIDGLQYVTYTSNVSANLALAQGELDWAGNFVNNIDNEYVGKDPANNHYWFPAVSPTYLTFNMTKPQYQNADVRKAVSLALDREELVRIAEQNEQPANTTPTGLVFPQHEPFVADKYKNVTLKQDVEQSKALLAKAGYKPGGDGILVGPDGKRFSITLLTSSGFTDILTMYQVMTEQFKKVGIEVKVESKATNEAIAATMTGSFDMTTFGPIGGAYSPFSTYERTLAGYLTAPIGQPSFANVGRWKDPATDALLQKYAAATDDATRKQALDGLQDIMVDQVPVVPLFNFVSWSETSTKKVTGWPSKDNPYSVGGPSAHPGAVLIATTLEPKTK